MTRVDSNLETECLFDWDVNEKFEYEQNDCTTILKGRLKCHSSYWVSINASPLAIDVIKHGYRLPFIETPVKVILENNKSAYEYREFAENSGSDWSPSYTPRC